MIPTSCHFRVYQFIKLNLTFSLNCRLELHSPDRSATVHSLQHLQKKRLHESPRCFSQKIACEHLHRYWRARNIAQFEIANLKVNLIKLEIIEFFIFNDAY